MLSQTTRPRPNTFIIGAPKCGTTSLYEYLRGHPEVYMSASKEPGYFAPDNLVPDSQKLRYGDDEERYLSFFAEAGAAKRIGEASVGYIYSERAHELIHQFDPDARIIAMFRNPVDMIHSLHNQRLSEGREEVTDFRAAIEREVAQGGWQAPTEPGRPAKGTYRDRALFSRYLPRWLETFGPQRVHVVILEDLERDPAGEFGRVLEFLAVDPDYQPEQFRAFNVRHQPRSHVLRRLTKSAVPQFLVWKVLPRVVGDVGTRRLVRGFRHSRLNRRSAERTPVDPALRRRLEEYYAPDVEQLSRLLGRDLAELWWGRPVLGPVAATPR